VGGLRPFLRLCSDSLPLRPHFSGVGLLSFLGKPKEYGGKLGDLRCVATWTLQKKRWKMNIYPFFESPSVLILIK